MAQTSAQMTSLTEQQKQNLQQAIQQWEQKVALLGPWEQKEIAHCQVIFEQLFADFGASAELAMVHASLKIALQRGAAPNEPGEIRGSGD